MPVLFLIGLVGCAATDQQGSPYPEPGEFAQPFNRPPGTPPEAQVKPTFATYNPVASTVFPDYQLNIGDVLEIIYHVRTEVSSDAYRLKVQDVISIRFPFQKAFDQDVTVQSDGTIRMLLVGEIRVVRRGERGISRFHFRPDPQGEGWLRFNPDLGEDGQWEAYPFLLVRTLDGSWWKRDPVTNVECRLEEELPLEETGRLAPPCIVDAMRPGGQRDRFEYDRIQKRWKIRPSYVEQEGLGAEKLQTLLLEKYEQYLLDPELTVTVRQANIKISELKKAITTAPRGQSRLMPIKPDGTIDLPFVGEVPAYGKTIQQLKMDIEAAYAQVDLPEISVTVQMNQWAPNKIYVLGEVGSPGLLTVSSSMTLLQAIATAGGTNARAARDVVMVVRRKGLPIPEATIVNLYSLTKETPQAKAGDVPGFANLRFDFYLADGDIIYVPSTALAVAGDWVDLVFNRIIRSIVPYQFYTGLNFNYEVHSEPQKVDNGANIPNTNIQLGP